MSEKSETVMPEMVELLKVMIQRQDETTTAVKALAVEMRGMRDDLSRMLALHDRFDQLEARVVKLEGRPARRPGARR